MSSPAASTSTARDDTTMPHSEALSSPGSRRTAPGTRSTTSSRMPRTVNTIPVWARKDEPSPPPSRSTSPTPETRKRSISKSLPRPPKPAFLQAAPHAADLHDIEERRIANDSPASGEENGPSRFWSFTMPAKRRGRLNAESKKQLDQSSDSSSLSETNRGRRSSYSNLFSNTIGDAFSNFASNTLVGRQRHSQGAEEEDEKIEQGDVEPTEEDGWRHEENTRDTSKDTQARRKLDHDMSFSRHQPLTPGWESPWRPETRVGNSIEFGNYRYNHFGEGGYFPRSDTARSSQRGKIVTTRNGMTIVQARDKAKSSLLTVDWWKRFLLENAFVPLLFRAINIAFTTSVLAIAIRLHLLLVAQGAQASVGSSPIVAIIFAPLTLLHVMFQIWLEYFSRPIGLWEVSSKLFYTLIDLIFVCLWSAELSLSFDNYFTSTLVCTTFASPYAPDPSSLPTGGQQRLNDPSVKPSICSLQRALIGLVFVSLIAYVVVLTVSLFRIFVRVSRR